MSYAGTYDQSEICEHDVYRRNCWKCNGDVERFAKEYPGRKAHAEAQILLEKFPELEEVPFIKYTISCPGCEVSRIFDTQDEAKKWYYDHREQIIGTYQNWRDHHEIWAEIRKRGLDVSK